MGWPRRSLVMHLRWVETEGNECRIPREFKVGWFSGTPCEPTALWTYVLHTFRWVFSSFFGLFIPWPLPHGQGPAKLLSPQWWRIWPPRVLTVSFHSLQLVVSDIASFLSSPGEHSFRVHSNDCPVECHRLPPWQQTLPTLSTSKYPDLLACLPEATPEYNSQFSFWTWNGLSSKLGVILGCVLISLPLFPLHFRSENIPPWSGSALGRWFW